MNTTTATENYKRYTTRAGLMIVRAEREGFGRNEAASRTAIKRYLLAAQRVAATELGPDMDRADRFGGLMLRAEALGVYL